MNDTASKAQRHNAYMIYEVSVRVHTHSAYLTLLWACNAIYVRAEGVPCTRAYTHTHSTYTI